MKVEKSRHYDIHYYENSISDYQLIFKEHYWLIVLIICMIHYLLSAVIYKISCSSRVAPNFSFNFHFNYLEYWNNSKNDVFVGILLTKRKLSLKIQKQMVLFQALVHFVARHFVAFTSSQSLRRMITSSQNILSRSVHRKKISFVLFVAIYLL